MGSEARPGQPRERHRVAGRRIDRIDGRDPGRAMVRVIDPAAAVEDRVGIGREHRIGLEGADLAHELLAQRQVVGQRPVGTVEERHARRSR